MFSKTSTIRGFIRSVQSMGIGRPEKPGPLPAGAAKWCWEDGEWIARGAGLTEGNINRGGVSPPPRYPRPVAFPATQSRHEQNPRPKYIELINMHLRFLSEEDLLKVLVMLVETKKSRAESERDDVRKLLVDDPFLKFKL